MIGSIVKKIIYENRRWHNNQLLKNYHTIAYINIKSKNAKGFFFF